MACTNAERDCGKTRNGAECDRRTLLELRDQCRNVGATSLLDLDLHPNVAGIGTLQRARAATRWFLVEFERRRGPDVPYSRKGRGDSRFKR